MKEVTPTRSTDHLAVHYPLHISIPHTLIGLGAYAGFPEIKVMQSVIFGKPFA